MYGKLLVKLPKQEKHVYNLKSQDLEGTHTVFCYHGDYDAMHSMHENRLDGRLALRTLTGRFTPSVQAVYGVHSQLGNWFCFTVMQMKG